MTTEQIEQKIESLTHEELVALNALLIYLEEKSQPLTSQALTA